MARAAGVSRLCPSEGATVRIARAAGRSRQALCLLLACLLAGACAETYYDSYREANPDWYGDFPTLGASLHETLAGLYTPRVADYRLNVVQLQVLALRGGSFTPLTKSEIEALLASQAAETTAIVATLRCTSKVDLRMYQGEKVSWFLLPQGKLAGYDAYLFADDLCTVYNEFVPASLETAALEGQVRAYRDAHFPESMVHVGLLYQHGIAYAANGRLEDARRMLAEGDRGVDVAARERRPQAVAPRSRQAPTASASDIDRARAGRQRR
jgi:hypothetical protein